MKIREKRVIRPDGSTGYIYFARFGRKWVDLTPCGNCVARAREALR
jgi:hypothetical protein